MRKNRQMILTVILALAMIVRVIYQAAVPDRMDRLVISDMRTYDNLAVNLIEKGYYGLFDKPWSYRPPLYSLFLSLVYRFFGHSHPIARVVQAGLATLSVLLVFYIARELIGEPGALLAAFLTAADFSLIHLSGLFLSENLYIPLSLVLIMLLMKGLQKQNLLLFIGAGVAGGLAALCRPTVLPFLFLAILIPFFPATGFGRRTLKGAATTTGQTTGPNVPKGFSPRWKTHPKGCGYNGAKQLPVAAGFSPRTLKGLAGWAVMILAVGLTIAPWTIRNWRLHRAFVPVSTNAGTMLWMGLHPGAPGGYHFPKENNPLYAMDDEVQRNRVGIRESVRFVREHPHEFLRLAVVKMRIFWGGYLFTWSGRQWAVYGILGLGGLILSLQKWRRWLLLYVYLAAFIGPHLLVHSGARYRLPLHPLIAIWAAFLVLRIWDKFLSQSHRQL